MQGHRKSSCAPLDSGDTVEEDVLGIDELPSTLKQLNIASPDFIRDREHQSKAFIRDRRRKSAASALIPSDTTSSLSTTSNEIVARLLQPGIFDNTRVEDETSRIICWQETIAPESFKKVRQVMPCTLVAPSPDSSFLRINPSRSFQKAESPDPTLKPLELEKDASPSFSRHPLSRSMSAEQRDIFMSKLADQAAATIHVIPKVDAEVIQSQAVSLNFITHLVMNDDKNDSQALLVLGRDESSVKDLVRKVEEENEKAAVNSMTGQTKSSSNLKAVAGAAVVGAVGTWAGLAFS
jgi:hypothetical protein